MSLPAFLSGIDTIIYSCEDKYIKEYLEGEFPEQDIIKIMKLVKYAYFGNISICVDKETDEVVGGDEDLMNFIQAILIIMSEDSEDFYSLDS
jgi:hypothetical protein